jgi:flagellin-like hook-associated protein FlgL
MRIADNMRFDTVQRSLSALRSRQAVLTGQISSGSKIAAPSDDPAAASRLTRIAAQGRAPPTIVRRSAPCAPIWS